MIDAFLFIFLFFKVETLQINDSRENSTLLQRINEQKVNIIFVNLILVKIY